ncbi:MAG TPA: cupredoxin domain-containing protein [candidate division Zixibacteria bacterium]|nr:cupredoxin domain-containing protein [candidate division Zixibacteria bacterium]
MPRRTHRSEIVRVRGLPVMAVLLVLGGTATACGSHQPLRVEIRVHYSRFEPSTVTVPRGVPVTFVLVNTDPIDHEWLIGDAAFHQRHRTGTEAVHEERPNELTLPALHAVQTTLTFDEPGELAFICHLPGHEAYGMVGTLTVL